MAAKRFADRIGAIQERVHSEPDRLDRPHVLLDHRARCTSSGGAHADLNRANEEHDSARAADAQRVAPGLVGDPATTASHATKCQSTNFPVTYTRLTAKMTSVGVRRRGWSASQSASHMAMGKRIATNLEVERRSSGSGSASGGIRAAIIHRPYASGRRRKTPTVAIRLDS